MARRRKTSCSCIHAYEDGSVVSGQGSIANPFSHERPSFLCMKIDGQSTNLTVDERGYVIIPDSVTSILFPNGTTITLDGNNVLNLNYMQTMTYSTVEQASATSSELSAITSGTKKDIKWTSIGHTDSGAEILPVSTTRSPTQHNVYVEDNASEVIVSAGQYASELVARGPASLDIEISGDKVPTVEQPVGGPIFSTQAYFNIWPDSTPLDIVRESTSVSHISFTLNINPQPGAWSSGDYLAFRIDDRLNSKTYARGMWEPEYPDSKTYHYVVVNEYDQNQRQTLVDGFRIHMVEHSGWLQAFHTIRISDIIVTREF